MKKIDGNGSKKEIKYIGYYDLPDSLQKRAFALSAINKMDYVCDALQQAGYNIHLISPSWFIDPATSFKRQTTVHLNTYTKLTLCPSFGTFGTLSKYLKVLFSLTWLFLYLLIHVRRDESILVYNATWLSLPVRMAKYVKGFSYILEVEEIYGEVWNIREIFKSQERKLIANADSYIFASDILANKFPHANRTILYGAYSPSYCNDIRDLVSSHNSKHKNIVFAGEIETTRCGAFTAVQCAKFLPEEFVVHVLGYGSEFDVNLLNVQIKEVNKNLGRDACVFHGTLIGSNLSAFLHNCDIAINPQKKGAYMDTAFPSKILTYLSHNLRVVSTKINSIQGSRLCSLIDFATDDSPEAIAHAIHLVDLTTNFDSRSVLKQLDEQFVNEIRALIESH
jgi:hypothetical protein